MINISAIIISVFITIVLIPIFTKLALRFGAVDMPEPRKMHASPIPRIGGAAIAIGTFVPVILWSAPGDFVHAYLAGAGALVIFGLVDDLRGIGYKMKFLGQLGAALIIVCYGGVRISYLGSLLPDEMVLPNWFAIALSLVVIVGVTNAINLADGLDGLAGGISLLGLCCIAYFAHIAESGETLLIVFALGGAIFGFLRFNTYPASIFMGDSGSQLLGFTAIVLSIRITQGAAALSPVLPLIILGFPILDTLTVMLERVMQGRSPFAPDKNHFHHRLIRLGFQHTEAVFIIYMIQSLMIVSAVVFRYHYAWLLLAGYAAFSILIIAVFTLADRTGFSLPRYRLIDHIIKGRLRVLRDENLIIRVSFEIAKLLLPLLFVFSCLIPSEIPRYAALLALGFSALLIIVWIFRKSFLAIALRATLFLMIPFILYLGDEGRSDWLSANLLTGYHLVFLVLTLFIILSVKFSRRVRGFQVTTMDYLIIFIAVFVPNLPGQAAAAQGYHLGSLTVKLIVLLFGYEVLITELRGKFDSLAVSTLTVLAIIALRGIV